LKEYLLEKKIAKRSEIDGLEKVVRERVEEAMAYANA